jgi:hypothetical protein
MSTVTPPIEPTQIAEPLDDYLMQVVQTLHAAVNQGMRRLHDNPQGATQQVKDAEEMIDIIMAGDVKEWLG